MKRATRVLLRSLKRRQRALAVERDYLRELAETVGELAGDTAEATEHLESAIEILSRLQ